MAEGLRPAQLRAVRAPGSVAVVAGAGTGKTHMLAHRYLKHVRDGLDPLEVVAVTFTERAAAELRSRIRTLLHTELPSEARARLTVESAQISTMHALAQRICREFPEQAGVAPDFTILDELEGNLWLTERIESALGDVPGPLFEAVSYHSVRAALSVLLADPITTDAAFTYSPEAWSEVVEAARAEARSELTGAPGWQEAAAVVRSLAGVEGDRREMTRREAAGALAQLAHGDFGAGLAGLAGLSLVGGSKKAFPEGDFVALGDAIKYLREATRGAQATGLVELELGEADDTLAALLPLLHAAYRSIRERLESEKRARRVLDFADLEVHALRALADAEVVDHYRSRWRALLVDEFQDTNAVQEKILNVLAATMIVTVVGDEKQSIYGFRGASSEVFERYRARVVADGGDVVVLSETFRSHAGLTDVLNATFAPLLAADHQELTAVRTELPSAGPYTTLSVIAGKGAKAGRQLSEARALGSAIRGLVDGGARVHDRLTGELRPVRYGDVAVLARGWRALGVYGEVLPALGVPAVHTGGGNLLAMREVKDGITLLRALAEPTDDVGLVALLRSPYFAIDDVTLYRLAGRRAAMGADGPARSLPLSFWEALMAEPRLDGGLERARGVIADLLTRRGSLAPSDLLLAADSLTGHSAVLAGLPGGRRRLTDHGGFLDLVRRLEAGSQDLFTVWRRLRLLLAGEVEVARPSLAAEGAVTLLTIHGSKGLEWPVVVVADLVRRGPTQRPPVLIDPSVGVALRLEDEEGEPVDPAMYRVMWARRAAREEQEARRLLYVALTRARDYLLLSAAAEAGGALDVLEPGLAAAGVARVVVTHDPELAVYPAPVRPQESLTDPVPEEATHLVVPISARGSARGGQSRAGPAGDGVFGAGDAVNVVDAGHVVDAVNEVGAANEVDAVNVVDAWSATLDLVATLEDAWVPVTHALAEADVRPPATELAGRWLRWDAVDTTEAPQSQPTPTPRYVLLAWRVPDGVLVLVDAASERDEAARDGTPPGKQPVQTEFGDAVAVGRATIARRPVGASVGDEVTQVWLLHAEPVSRPGTTLERVRSALSAVDDKREG
ncbi:MAG TPA: UvrD-helicase domain-containing protein [Trueperaceae bacterium]|nr:UvrD-helicase domain-containing protein [Trueperaceae bacterium]